MSLKHEPATEPLHISVQWLSGNLSTVYSHPGKHAESQQISSHGNAEEKGSVATKWRDYAVVQEVLVQLAMGV